MNAIVNTLALNADGVLFAGADNGNMSLYDYKTGLPFQTMSDIPQPGSLDAEAGIFASAFDQTVRRRVHERADQTGHSSHHGLRRQDGQDLL